MESEEFKVEMKKVIQKYIMEENKEVSLKKTTEVVVILKEVINVMIDAVVKQSKENIEKLQAMKA